MVHDLLERQTLAMDGECLVAGVLLEEMDRVGFVGNVVHIESKGPGLVGSDDVRVPAKKLDQLVLLAGMSGHLDEVRDHETQR